MEIFKWQWSLGSIICIVYLICGQTVVDKRQRTFTIDYDNNTFLLDGEPFQYIAGSFHYFRAVPQSWSRILKSMRAAGLNAVTTYVEWSLHNPKEDVYSWEGIADIEHFIQLAQSEDLFVILRPGPYICAERDMGGFPYWLLHKYPAIQLRTSDIAYLHEVRTWYAELFSRLERYFYGNGGPIIMVQVENEYGSFFACDHKYMTWLRDETERYVRGQAVLFTNNGPGLAECGGVDGVLNTLDFGPGTTEEINDYWNELRKHQPRGPLVNAEYYPGWLTHWQEPTMSRVAIAPVTATLREMLSAKVNINIYMFYGGTNFGFTAGANEQGAGHFVPDITSYDYDAPIDESGDPTPKYYAIRQVISMFFPIPNVPVPIPLQKMSLPSVLLTPIGSALNRGILRVIGSPKVTSIYPLTFEALNQYSGIVLYEALLPNNIKTDPMKLTVSKIHDRGYVYIDSTFVGVLSRQNAIDALPIILGLGRKLQIVVESEGRVNFGTPNDFKGLIGDVFINEQKIQNWTMIGIPLDNIEKIQNLCNKHRLEKHFSNIASNFGAKPGIVRGPTIFHGTFDIAKVDILDTYVNPIGWGKGVLFINKHNLGRYWPGVGPQLTLYVPKAILKKTANEIILIEYQTVKSPSMTIEFDSSAKFN
ncbi:beta-galactosidase-1-like protein [Toxorhynchites rutilus septentrionalis]|uniref:beta-galactosidase-1-like protein n=1 Tax=Toxorhynchites rutilus septentrionalis TaxID=329112 RepID=UPI00247865D8|nr:beta-galactosidase-1-like protein [Toxorhynchites rutilus septentrionalis]